MDYTDYPSTDMHPDHSNFVFLAAMYEPTTNASSMANNSLAPITTGFGNYGGNGATMQPWGQGGGTSSSSQGNQAGGNGGAGHGNGMGGHFHSGNRRHLRAPVHQREDAATDQVPQWLAQWHEIQEADMMAKSQSDTSDIYGGRERQLFRMGGTRRELGIKYEIDLGDGYSVQVHKLFSHGTEMDLEL